jgi:hypothetical protein
LRICGRAFPWIIRFSRKGVYVEGGKTRTGDHRR